jgi:hypothetical protein
MLANSTLPLSFGASHINDTRVAGLLFLREYALRHTHSRRWLAAIATLLTREAGAHG